MGERQQRGGYRDAADKDLGRGFGKKGRGRSRVLASRLLAQFTHHLNMYVKTTFSKS